MRSFHKQIARIGLSVLDQFGFVLAGGYAMSAHGIGNRPSMDVDLFTDRNDPRDFLRAKKAFVEAMEDSGLIVAVRNDAELFFDVLINDPIRGESGEIQLAYDYRLCTPVVLSIGPVLDIHDAAGAKMSALYSRGEARDYVDIFHAVESDAFTLDQLIELADEREAFPMDRGILINRFRSLFRHSAEAFVAYDINPTDRLRMIAQFNYWATHIESRDSQSFDQPDCLLNRDYDPQS